MMTMLIGQQRARQVQVVIITIIIVVIVIVIIISVGHPHHYDDHVKRSATIVLAFLLQHEAMSLQDAIKQVKY